MDCSVPLRAVSLFRFQLSVAQVNDHENAEIKAETHQDERLERAIGGQVRLNCPYFNGF